MNVCFYFVLDKYIQVVYFLSMNGEIDNPIYPIQLVSRRSGLSVDLIRAWERRYRVVIPKRAQNQRRMYSELDVQHLTLLHRLTAQGHRIGDIAELEKGQLEELLESVVIGRQSDTNSAIMALRQQALLMVEEVDPEGLSRLLAEAELQLPLPMMLSEWIAPLMALIGGAWRRGELRIYQEHMASAVIAGWMMSKIRQQQTHSGPVLLVTTLSGQRHSLGAMMVTLLANSFGWQAHYLDDQLPAQEIAAAAKHLKARAIALSISYVQDATQLQSELNQLHQLKPDGCPILAGGAVVSNYQKILREISVVVLEDLHQLGEQLERLAGPSLNS